MTNKITSWSFSRYADYTLCPAKAKFKHIDKLKEPPNAAMARGSEVHTMAERYIKGELAKLPSELKLFKKELAELRKQYKARSLPIIVEDSWAFTQDWDITRWNDWVGCWVRIKLDAAHQTTATHMVVTDWKTGKVRDDKTEEYLMQLELYALAAMLQCPHIESVEPRLAYVDAGATFPKEPVVYTRKDIPGLKKLWAQRVRPMFTDTRFAPKPNNLCRFCHFRKDNGGPCKF